MPESRDLEYKQSYSRSFLKTVSAFANQEGGRVLFGVTDDGVPVGLEDPVQLRLDIENAINDSLSPRPEYSLDTKELQGVPVVWLTVRAGTEKPYLYHSKAYKRADAATVPVTDFELRRLLLAGQHRAYEELPAANQDLRFTQLGERFLGRTQVNRFDMDTLKTLGLYRDGRYNNAAAVLADESSLPGANLLRFGGELNQILDTERVAGVSAVETYERALGFYRRYGQHEELRGSDRVLVEDVPELAFREAVANGLVHREWDVPAPLSVAFFPDRVEMVSPGGLPPELSVDSYLNGFVSIQRNPLIAGVFARLGWIELYGTGIRRIKEAYAGRRAQPSFEVGESSLRITLPFAGAASAERPDDILGYLDTVPDASRDQVQEALGLSRTQTVRKLNDAIAAGVVERLGAGPSTRYRLVG